MAHRPPITAKITLRVSSPLMLSRLVHVISTRAELLSVDLDAAPVDVTERQPNPLQKIDRNEEIVARYAADPKANSSGKLAEEYGVSRERICQILRPVNAIATAQERRRAAREATVEEAKAIRAAAKEEMRAAIENGVSLVQSGLSTRQAVAQLGFKPNSHFTNALNAECRARAIPTKHGRWRDFSVRRLRATELRQQGLTIPQIVNQLRAEGDNAQTAWFYTHMPELKITEAERAERQLPSATRDYSKRRERAAELGRQGLSIPKIAAQLRAEGDNQSPNWFYAHMPELRKNPRPNGAA